MIQTHVNPTEGLVPGQDRPFSPGRGSQSWPQLFSALCPCGHPLQRVVCQTWGFPPGHSTRRTTGRTTSEETGSQNLFLKKTQQPSAIYILI